MTGRRITGIWFIWLRLLLTVSGSAAPAIKQVIGISRPSTQGRSRQDRCHCMNVPVKDIYLYPLDRGFREKLTKS